MKTAISRLSVVLVGLITGCGPDASDIFSREVDQDLVEAAAKGDIDGIDAALAAGADINAIGEKGYTPLFVVYYQYKNRTGYEYLLEMGADPNIQQDNGFAVMNFVASERVDSEWLRLALEHGGDPNLRWEYTGHPRQVGSTPLLDAVYSESPRNLELLIEYGADINVVDDEKGYAPVINACTGLLPHMAKWLLEHGADWTIETSEGVGVAEAELANSYDVARFPIEAAAHEWILDFLEEKGVDLEAA